MVGWKWDESAKEWIPTEEYNRRQEGKGWGALVLFAIAAGCALIVLPARLLRVVFLGQDIVPRQASELLLDFVISLPIDAAIIWLGWTIYSGATSSGQTRPQQKSPPVKIRLPNDDNNEPSANEQYIQPEAVLQADESAIRQSKADQFSTALIQHFRQFVAGASQQTIAAVDAGLSELAQSMTLGRTILPNPITDVLIAVAHDKGIKEAVRRRVWKNHLTVLSEVVRVFQGNKMFWHNPEAVDKSQQFPPGSAMNYEMWEEASEGFRSIRRAIRDGETAE